MQDAPNAATVEPGISAPARTLTRFRVHAAVGDGGVGVWLDAVDVEHLRGYGFSTREE